MQSDSLLASLDTSFSGCLSSWLPVSRCVSTISVFIASKLHVYYLCCCYLSMSTISVVTFCCCCLSESTVSVVACLLSLLLLCQYVYCLCCCCLSESTISVVACLLSLLLLSQYVYCLCRYMCTISVVAVSKMGHISLPLGWLHVYYLCCSVSKTSRYLSVGP